MIKLNTKEYFNQKVWDNVENNVCFSVRDNVLIDVVYTVRNNAFNDVRYNVKYNIYKHLITHTKQI